MRRALALCLLLSASAYADKIPSPKDFLGFDVCADYQLANYRQLAAYWEELASKSDRISVESIGKTEDGRDQLMCVVTDPSNRYNLENYRKGSERLARAQDFKNDDDARSYAGKQRRSFGSMAASMPLKSWSASTLSKWHTVLLPRRTRKRRES